MRHRGQPATNIGVVTTLLGKLTVMSSGSDETQELSADNISEDEFEIDAFGDSTSGLGLDGERFSSKSNMGLSPTRLISLCQLV